MLDYLRTGMDVEFPLPDGRAFLVGTRRTLRILFLRKLLASEKADADAAAQTILQEPQNSMELLMALHQRPSPFSKADVALVCRKWLEQSTPEEWNGNGNGELLRAALGVADPEMLVPELAQFLAVMPSEADSVIQKLAELPPAQIQQIYRRLAAEPSVVQALQKEPGAMWSLAQEPAARSAVFASWRANRNPEQRLAFLDLIDFPTLPVPGLSNEAAAAENRAALEKALAELSELGVGASLEQMKEIQTTRQRLLRQRAPAEQNAPPSELDISAVTREFVPIAPKAKP